MSQNIMHDKNKILCDVNVCVTNRQFWCSESVPVARSEEGCYQIYVHLFDVPKGGAWTEESY
jgi:hypothetical protein